MDEMTTLINTCAKLTAFLRDSSFFETHGDVISDSVQRELDALAAADFDKQTKIVCDGLRNVPGHSEVDDDGRQQVLCQ